MGRAEQVIDSRDSRTERQSLGILPLAPVWLGHHERLIDQLAGSSISSPFADFAKDQVYDGEVAILF